MHSDSRTHILGLPCTVRLQRVNSGGWGAIGKASEEDGRRLAVAGRESLRIIRASGPDDNTAVSRPSIADSALSYSQKSTTSQYGHRLESSRNLWEGSGLKVDSALTDVGWGHGTFSNKIFTSARNGELIMWDLNKSSGTKFERRTKDHIRSIHKLSISSVVHYYCVTGSADGDVRVWDLRDLSGSLMKIHHPTSVRSVVFSTSPSTPLQIGVGLDNGSIYRWDLLVGQRRHMDRLPIAHTGPILTLDWSNACASTRNEDGGTEEGNMNVGAAGLGASGAVSAAGNSSSGWIVSGGLDHTVKVWNASLSHIPHRPAYALHPSFPVRRVLWRPGYECELAVVSNYDFGTGGGADSNATGIGSTVDGNGVGTIAGAQLGSGGDAVEIWDVRRGWIAKWTVGGSGVEGGVNDIAFADSHTLWAQHPSGTLSQLDLRDSYKPLDAIPRTSVSWDAGGSLAFISEKKGQWEVPFDDVHPDEQHSPREHKPVPKLKRIGDPPASPTSQNFGIYTKESALRDTEAFIKLARGYVFEGTDRGSICSVNAQKAYDAGKSQAAQAWLLMGSLLSDIVPPPTPLPSPPALPHSISAPATIPTIHSLPYSPREPTGRASSEPAFKTSSLPRHNGGSPSRPNSRHVTPVSSNPGSPHRIPIGLPPSTPVSRGPSMAARDRRGSNAGLGLSIPRRISSYSYAQSRPSLSSVHSESPSDSMRSHSSHRHVGEGALDDSDSSGSEDAHSRSRERGGSESNSDEETGLRPLISPYQTTKIIPATPSPLSHIAGQQQWTEDEDDDKDNDLASPSPGSTDTESSTSGDCSSLKRNSSRTRRGSRTKSRSRSSTVASLAAPSLLHVRKPLVKQGSQSSIQTVIAGDASIAGQDSREDTIMDLTARHPKTVSPESRRRQQSRALSSEYVPEMEGAEHEELLPSNWPGKMSERQKAKIATEEAKFREIGWDTLREALNQFADEGDVQMCAMLSVIAPKELRVGKRRIVRFLESYIEILSHFRLHTSAAYIRKYSDADDIRLVTKLETTVYTSCGRCRKAIVVPSSFLRPGQTKGGYSYCKSCKYTLKCSICHLPVRTLLFQCSICAHGGHQECYRRYYMERPMVEISVPSASVSNEPRDRSVVRSSPLLSSSEQDDDGSSVATDAASETASATGTGTIVFPSASKISGHPCAAGCGHFCWAATGHAEECDG